MTKVVGDTPSMPDGKSSSKPISTSSMRLSVVALCFAIRATLLAAYLRFSALTGKHPRQMEFLPGVWLRLSIWIT
jgi:hypothetical protein